MEQTQNTPQKVNKGLIFSAQLNWLEKRKGKLYAEDVDNSLVVATPAAFGGEGREWSPEHLFLGSLNSCFMSTYLVLADKFQFPVSKLECNSCGLVEFVDGAYRFTSIEISAKIYVEEKWEEKAKVALQKTPKYCLISNSIKSKITHSGEVVVY